MARKRKQVTITMDEFIAANTVKVVPGAMTAPQFADKTGTCINTARVILLRGVKEGKLVQVVTRSSRGAQVMGFLPAGE